MTLTGTVWVPPGTSYPRTSGTRPGREGSFVYPQRGASVAHRLPVSSGASDPYGYSKVDKGDLDTRFQITIKRTLDYIEETAYRFTSGISVSYQHNP